MYRLMFSDLDETLLVNHHVPKMNQEAILKAREQGLKFVPCTGRAFNMIPDILKEIGTYDKAGEYSLCFNGGLIVENKDNKVLHFKGLDFKQAKEIFENARNLDVCVLVFTLDCCYIFHADEDEIQRKIAQKAKFKVIEDYDIDFLKDEKIAKILYEKRDMDYLKQLAKKLDELFFKHHSTCYGAIVAFGKNAADPHHENDDTLLRKGDCVLIDMGCVYKGYCSDMTRTFFYEGILEEEIKVYEIVKKANEAAEAMIKPGVKLSDIDKCARKVISDEGYGKYFTHRLGHFIGRDVHEYGDVSSVNEMKVEEGMIFSIEPGIYLEGNFGVRVEDLVMVTKDGCQVLNSFTKDIYII